MRRPRRLARTVIYEDPWINLYADRVRYPHGRMVERHHVVHFERPAAGAVIVDGRGRILLVKSYRYVTGHVAWEIPAGRCDKGESALKAARREALEESGWETTGHRLVYRYYPMNGISDQVFNVVRCRAVRDTGVYDKSEVAGVRWFSRAEARSLLARGMIKDGFSLVALLFELGGRTRR